MTEIGKNDDDGFLFFRKELERIMETVQDIFVWQSLIVHNSIFWAKAAIEREQNDACIDSVEREQARIFLMQIYEKILILA